MTAQDEIAALAKGLNASDAGRRVGWARAYEAEASKDDLSREVNMMRADRDIMVRASSFLYGYLMRYAEKRGDSGVVRESLTRWSAQVGAILDADVMRAGGQVADSHISMSEQARARREAREADKRERAKQARTNMDAARQLERAYLAKRFGFPNEAALLNHLAAYTGRPLEMNSAERRRQRLGAELPSDTPGVGSS